MKTLFQYTKARLGFWVPAKGEMYQADIEYRPNPFKPNDRPICAQVLAKRHHRFD